MKREKFTFDESLCKECLNYNKNEYEVIKKLADQLPMIANLMDANVFIDCVKWDTGEYIVVAEAIPEGAAPLYHECPVGEIALPENEPAVHRSVSRGIISRDILGQSQESFPIRQAVVPVFTSGNKPIGVLIREYRVDAEQKLEFLKNVSSGIGDSLYSAWNLDENIAKQIRESVLIADRDGKIIFRNEEARRMFQELEGEEDVMGRTIQEIGIPSESFFLSKGVSVIHLKGHILEVNYFYKEDNHNLCLILHDITKECETGMERRQQKFILNEMNHRIKNSLQSIVSFLNMQSYKTGDAKVKELFDESVNRVLAIADVHNMLSKTEEQNISLISLTEKICENIARLSDMDYDVEGDDIFISGEKASPYGMIINELIQNSAKHAIPKPGMKKHVSITIHDGNENVYVDISDNGKGLPKNYTEGMGLFLVKKLILERLSGGIDFPVTKEGLIASIYFLKK